jgi:hypothetical protein
LFLRLRCSQEADFKSGGQGGMWKKGKRKRLPKG